MDVEVHERLIETLNGETGVTAPGNPMVGMEAGEFVLPEAWWFDIQDSQYWMDLSA
jgi:hypothetical protein